MEPIYFLRHKGNFELSKSDIWGIKFLVGFGNYAYRVLGSGPESRVAWTNLVPMPGGGEKPWESRVPLTWRERNENN